jgi:hypothetical protein
MVYRGATDLESHILACRFLLFSLMVAVLAFLQECQGKYEGRETSDNVVFMCACRQYEEQMTRLTGLLWIWTAHLRRHAAIASLIKTISA